MGMKTVVWVAERRGVTVPPDWQTRVLVLGGERLGGDAKRMKVSAEPEIVRLIGKGWGLFLSIEPVVEHRPSVEDIDLHEPPIEVGHPTIVEARANGWEDDDSGYGGALCGPCGNGVGLMRNTKTDETWCKNCLIGWGPNDDNDEDDKRLAELD